MAKDEQKSPSPLGGSSPADDILLRVLEGAARLLLWAGVVLTVISVAFLFLTMFKFSNGTEASVAQARTNIELFRNLLLVGSLGIIVGSTYLFWGEEILGPLQLIGSAIFYFSPNFLPSVLGQGSGSPIPREGMNAFQFTGLVCGVCAILAIIGDVIVRVRLRMLQGAKADQMKYGKGIKAQEDVQNVFMGRCWQLPYCRKFVREKCPIYHAKRTCWKERVGCMCEESVIQNAMAGKIVPSDAVAAAQYIPRNSKLSPKMKFERCKSCIIYNEHQRHKYKLGLGGILLGTGVLYGLGRQAMLNGLDSVLAGMDSAVGKATLREKGASGLVEKATLGMNVFKEILLICLLLMMMAYLLKLIEFLFFKAKV